MVVFGEFVGIPHPTFCRSFSVLMELLREGGVESAKTATKNSKLSTQSTCTDNSGTLLNDPGTQFTGFLELPPLGDPYISNKEI
jgi:hypothetical protein